MAVLRNPLLFLLVLLIGGGAFVVVQAGLLGPLMKVGNAVFDQSVEIARVTSPFHAQSILYFALCGGV